MSKIALITTFILLMTVGCTTLPDEATDPIKQNTFIYFNISDGLLDSEVLSVFEDSSGNIWIGTYYGVTRYNGSTFVSYTPDDDGLITGGIVTIGEDYDGAMWVGSSDGFSIFDGDVWDTGSGLGITSFYLDRQSFWVGTETSGAFQLSDAGTLNYSVVGCDNCNYVTSFEEDKSGKLWYSTLAGAFKITDKINQTVEQLTSDDGLASDFLTRMQLDKWGNMWFGTYDADAISKYAGNNFKSVYLPTGNSEISGFAEGKDGLYITTRELGFLHYDGAVMTEIKTPNEDYSLNCITKDSKGNFWIGTYSSGLIKFTPKGHAL